MMFYLGILLSRHALLHDLLIQSIVVLLAREFRFSDRLG
jgi:hypothetical protein